MNKLVLAMALGDGHLSKRGTLLINHCEEQKEYIEWKASLFNKEVERHLKDGRPHLRLKANTSNKNLEGKLIRKKLYSPLGHKYISRTIAKEIDLFCLAILYLDRGSLHPKRSGGQIHAYELSIAIGGKQDECERLIKLLKEKWDLNFTLKFNRNKYSIRCGTREARKFLALIRPITPEFKCFSNNKLKFI